MAEVVFSEVDKIYDGGVHAVQDLSLEIADGEFLVLVGPSGCGKTTALRMLAGLETISDGTISIGNRVVNDVSSKERDIAMVFQSYALYPHLSVADNIAFGLQLRKMPKDVIAKRVDWAAKLLDLTPYLKRKPKELSGGQRQRVAMGRAIVRRPQAFLMDEPLSNLDATLRVSMRAELAKMHARLGVTTVYVTHDQVEAMTLGDRVAVMRAGTIQQCDTPRRLFDQPANVFVAAFIGSPSMNLVHGAIANGRVRLGSWELALPGEHPLVGMAARALIVGLRPSDFAADSLAPAHWPRIDVTPVAVEEFGHERNLQFPVDARRVEIEGFGGSSHAGLFADDTATPFCALLGGRANIAAGSALRLAVNTSALYFFEPDGGAAITSP